MGYRRVVAPLCLFEKQRQRGAHQHAASRAEALSISISFIGSKPPSLTIVASTFSYPFQRSMLPRA
jgi:hypothetical protein